MSDQENMIDHDTMTAAENALYAADLRSALA